MASLPEPQLGLVISYAFLWAEGSQQGRIEGRKDRPCAIVLLLEQSDHPHLRRVTVVPITHSAPADPAVAIEIPPRVKAHLGLDAERSWIILDEFNVFTWPGFDLRSIKGMDGRVDYGFLPPNLFAAIQKKIIALEQKGLINYTSRDE